MLWYIFWWLSLVTLLVSVVITIVSVKNKRNSVKSVYILFAGVFLSLVLLIYPIYKNAFNGDVGSILKAIIISSQNAIQFFSADSDFALITENISGLNGWLKEAYSLLGALLIILSPLLTFSFVLSFFKKATAPVRHFLHLPAETYVFSQINSRSVSLAESVVKENSKSIIVFTNVPKEEGNVDNGLMSRVKALDSILYAKAVSAIRIPWASKIKKLAFFAINENEAECINESLLLIEKYKAYSNACIYLFSSGIESELMINGIDKGSLQVRRVNPINSFVNHFLVKNATSLFDSAINLPNGKKEISVLILGAGDLGKELLKALSWYCQMEDYFLRINAFDKQENIKGKLEALCPEMFDERYNGKENNGTTYYDINIHSCDVKTKAFKDIVKNIGRVSYVFVALGDDSLNVATAVNMRVLFEQMHIHPHISAVVSDSAKSKALSGSEAKGKNPYDIHFIGDAQTIYSSEVILNSAVEKEALELHKRYNNGSAEGFYEYEYNYKSSMASVIHYEARKYCNIPGADKCNEALNDYERDIIEVLEHKRWNAYMRSEGFVYSGSEDKKSKNQLGKMHNNLVEFERLLDEDKRKDSRVGTKS